MNLKSLSLQAIDKLLEYWQTDTAKSVAESREESAAVIEAVFAPVIADLGRDVRQVSESCDAEIAERQKLDCQIFDLERCLGLAREALTALHRYELPKAPSDRFCWCDSRLTQDETRVRADTDHDPECIQASAALAQAGASQTDDEPHPEFIRGYLVAADDLAEPYPADVSFFAPLTKEQIEQAVEAMGRDISGRLHAEWARHWARSLRKRIADLEKP